MEIITKKIQPETFLWGIFFGLFLIYNYAGSHS